jgi:hypothetical protein
MLNHELKKGAKQLIQRLRSVRVKVFYECGRPAVSNLCPSRRTVNKVRPQIPHLRPLFEGPSQKCGRMSVFKWNSPKKPAAISQYFRLIRGKDFEFLSLSTLYTT